MEPFCVEFDYPLMKRRADMDPRKLKKAGAAQAKFHPHQLLITLGNKQLTTKEWEDATCQAYHMSKRTFADKKRILVERKSVTCVNEDKWQATGQLTGGDLEAPENLDNKLQTADAAIASAAATPSAVCATAAAALS